MSELLTTVALIFIIAGPFLLVANWFDLPTVPFLILAGILTGFFIDESLTLELAQYGIALLVFTFGVGIDIKNFEPLLGDSELAALGQILVVGILGTALGIVVGIAPVEAIFLGIAVAFSSTIVGTALLETEIRNNLLRGRMAESIQFVQDLVAIAILLVIGAETFAADPIATQIGYGISLLILAALVNIHVFDFVGRLAGDSDELMIIGVVSLLVLFIAASEIVGISIVVGAFAAGIAVRHDPIKYLGLFNGLSSIKDFFVAIFFVTIGALVVVPFVETGWTASVEKLLLVAGLVILTAVVKPAITAAVLIYKGYETRSAALTGLGTDQVSEFALIIAIEAFIFGLLTQNVFDAIILAAAVTMITSSLSHQHSERIYQMLSDRGLLYGTHGKVDKLSAVPESIDDHIIIVGYGRQGQQLATACADLDQPYVVIENDPALLEMVHRECEAYVFGDAFESYTWEKATVEDAALVISAVKSDSLSDRLLDFEFDADLILRTDDVEQSLAYLERGALYVSVADLLAGEQLVEHLHSLFSGERTPEQLREERLAELDEYKSMIKERTSDTIAPMDNQPAATESTNR